MKPRLTTLLATAFLALQLAQATNPPTPPGGKNNGDNNSGSDSTQSPSSGSSGSGSGGSSGTGNGSGTGGGKRDCDGTGSAGDPNSNNDGGCNSGPCDPVNPPPPSCIKDTIPLAFAPNDDGLGAGILQLYIEGTSQNLGSRSFLEFFGLPLMTVTKAQDLGGRTSYETIQAGGSKITFEINDSQAQAGWIVGVPVGGEAYSQARVTFVNSAGQPSQKAGAAFLRQFRAGSGYVDYPVNGGRAVRFVTNEGRLYSFPFAGVEVIRQRPDNVLVVNGSIGDGLVRQVKTLAGLLDVVALSDRSYEVRKYAISQVGAKGGDGIWPVSGAPIFTLKVEAPEADLNKLVVTRTTGTQVNTTTHVCTVDPEEGETWKQTITSGGFSVERQLLRAPQPALGPDYRKVTWTARLTAAPGMQIDPNAAPDYKREAITYRYAPVQSTETFKNGKVYQRTREFSEPTWDANGVGRETSQTTSTGTIVSYEIDPATQRMLSRSWQVQLPAGQGGSVPTQRLEIYAYEPLVAGEVVEPFDFRPRMTTTLWGGQPVGRSYYSYRIEGGEYVATEEVCATLESAFGDTASRRRESRYFGTGANKGRLREERAEDGTLTRYDYAAQAGGGLLITRLARLTAAGTPVNGASVRTKTLRDARGFPLEITSAHWVNGAWLDYETVYETRDNTGKLTAQSRKDLLSNQMRSVLTQEWDGENLVRVVDPAGVVTRYEYFPATSVREKEIRETVAAQGSFAAQPEIITSFSGTFQLDRDQQIAWERKNTLVASAGTSYGSSELRDERGHPIESTDANGYTTSYSRSVDRMLHQITRADGATFITRQSSDGELLSTTGTGVIPEFHHYSARVGGGTVHTVYTAQDLGPRWRRLESDAAGRKLRVSGPKHGGGEAEAVFNYDNGCPCGKPSRISTTGMPHQILQYDAVGDVIRTGTTGDDLTLSLSSQTDRVQERDVAVERVGNLLWAVTTSAVYAEAGSAAGKQVGLSRALIAGFTGNQIQVAEAVDITGQNVTRSITELDRATGLSTTRIIVPGSSDDALTIQHAGRVVSEHQPGSTGSVVTSYDPLGRPLAIQQPGHVHPETMAYEPGKNRVASTTDAKGATTQLSYVPQDQAGAGQVRTVTAPDGAVTTTEYDLLAHVVRVSGGRTYPVAYGFDAYGQLETITTWQDYAGNQGQAVTRMAYEAATGLLLSRTDAANRVTTFTYDAAHRASTATTARGASATFGYDPVTADLLSVDYNDATPDVSYSHDRLGRMLTATTANVARSTFTYHPATLLPQTETIEHDLDGDGTMDFQRVMTPARDGLLRPVGYSLGLGAAVDTSASFDYETVAGRVNSITSHTGQAFTYAYDPARAGLISSLTGPLHRVVNTWETDRDVLDVKSNQTLAGAVISAHDYTVNAVGQRTEVQTSGSAFSAPNAAGWTWEYDALGQLSKATHATTSTRHQGYVYDDIGNRKETTTGPPAAPASTTVYAANLLNQYSSISQAAGPVVPQHDLDGNLLSGATGAAANKSFEWDAASRLVAVKDAAGVEIVRYTYDHAGRKVRRTSGGASTLLVYRGWHCLAEYSVTGGSAALSKTYTWGMDLSGTAAGAGGAGGLLAQTVSGTSSYPLYDGSGNVTEYLDATGAVAAHLEYDGFGKVISSSGNTAAYAYQFSTKPVDAATGWLDYGFRWYDPESGRWPSRDPIAEAGGLNLYAFVGNNGVNAVDVLGLNQCCPEGGIGQLCCGGNTRCCKDDIVTHVGPDGTRWQECNGKQDDEDGGGGGGGLIIDPEFLLRMINGGNSCSLGGGGEAPAEPIRGWANELHHQMHGSEIDIISNSSVPTLDQIQEGLDYAGLVEGPGTLADLTNAGISTFRGHFGDAALSMGAAVPLVGGAFGIAKLGKWARHHTIPRAVMKKLSPAVAADKRIRGCRGSPNIQVIRKEVHEEIHSSPPGDYYPGGDYNRMFDELIETMGGHKNVTVDQVLAIRNMLVRYFDL